MKISKFVLAALVSVLFSSFAFASRADVSIACFDEPAFEQISSDELVEFSSGLQALSASYLTSDLLIDSEIKEPDKRFNSVSVLTYTSIKASRFQQEVGWRYSF